MALWVAFAVPGPSSYCVELLGRHQKNQQQQKARLMQGVAGLKQRRKKYRNLNDRVQRTISAYGQSEVLLYLRAIAHLSHV